MNLDYIVIASFVISVAALIWKMAQLANKIEVNEKNIKEYKDNHDNHVSDKNDEVNELRAQIITIIQSQAKIEERINFIIEELKNRKACGGC